MYRALCEEIVQRAGWDGVAKYEPKIAEIG